MFIIKTKNPKIQILRAIAIIAVVLIHTCPQGEVQVYIRPFINFAVALFIFLSGYLTDLENINIKDFYKKRILKVIIPYIIWTVIYTTFSFIGSGIDLKKYIINICTTKAAVTLYYIFVYIQFVLITPLLAKLIKSKFNCAGWMITPLFLIIKYVVLFNNYDSNRIISVLLDICCFGWFVFYYLGLLLGNKKIKIDKIKTRKIFMYIFIIIGCIILQILEGYGLFAIENENAGTQLKASSVLTNLIFMLVIYRFINNDKIKGDNKILVWIGNISFGIYLSHILILKILKMIPIYKDIPYGINSIIVLFFTIMLVYIIKRFLNEKICKWIGFC